MKKPIIVKIMVFAVWLLAIATTTSAQRQIIDDILIVLPDTSGVLADAGRRYMHKDLAPFHVNISGYYRILPKVYYDDKHDIDQLNESFYMTVKDTYDNIIYSVDPNADIYRIVLDTVFVGTIKRNSGLFNLPAGDYTLQLHHIKAIEDFLKLNYPEFITGEITGPESVKFPDSIWVRSEPIVDGTVKLRSDVSRMEQFPDGKHGVVYPGETISYDIVVKNIENNTIRDVIVKNHLPENLTFLDASLPYKIIDARTQQWIIKEHIEPQDSFIIKITAHLNDTIPLGYTMLEDKVAIKAPNDKDISNDTTELVLYGFHTVNFDGSNDVLKRDQFIDIDRDGGISVDDEIDYTITLHNSGNGTAHQVVVSDSIPNHTVYVQGSATTSQGYIMSTSPILEAVIGDMVAGSTITITFRVRIVSPVAMISNQGYVVSAETEPHPTDDPDTPAQNDPTVTDPPMFNGDTDVLKEDWFIDTDHDGGISIGDLINYTITLHNSGHGTAHQVVFTDSIPAYTEYVEGTAFTTLGGIISTSPLLEVAIGDVPGGSSVSIMFQVRVVAAVNSIWNQGYVVSAETEPHPTDDPDTPEPNDRTVTAPPMFNGDADVLKEDRYIDVDRDGGMSPGDFIDYTVSIHNSGMGTAHQVVFRDSIPAHTEYVAGTAGTTQGVIVNTSPEMEVAIGDMPGGSTVIITFRVRVLDRIALIWNQGYIVSAETEPHPTDDPDTPEPNDRTVTAPPMFNGDADVLKEDRYIDVDRDGGMSPGDFIDYTVSIHNSGMGTAHQVVFRDSIPVHTEYVAGTAGTTQGVIVNTSPEMEVAIGDMPGGSTVIITFRVRVLDRIALIWNQGYIVSAETEPHPTDDPDTPEPNDRTVTAPPMFNGDADVLKEDRYIDVDRDGGMSIGDLIDYQVTLHNSGYGTAHQVVFRDTIPENTMYIAGSATTTQGMVMSTSPVLEVSVGDMPGGSSVNISFRVQIAAEVDSVWNQGTMVSLETEPHPTDDPDTPEPNDRTVTDPPMFNKEADVLKEDTFIDVDRDGGISIGDMIRYTITVHNSGHGTAHQVAFTDTIPDYMVYVEGSANTSQGTIVTTSPVLEIAIGDMPGGSTVSIAFSVRFIEQVAIISNQGYLVSSETEPHPTDDPDTPEPNDRTVTDPPMFNGNADVLKQDTFIDVDRDGGISNGDLIRYTITLHNSGHGTAHQVAFRDTIPEHSVYIDGSLTTTQGTVVSTSPVLEVAIGDMIGSSTVTISFNVRVVERAVMISNQGYLESSETEPHPTDDPDTAEKNDPTVTAPPMFNGETDVLKRDEFIDVDRDGGISYGDLINYTISIHNSGNGTAHQVVFTDSMPAHTVYVEGTASTTQGDIVSVSPILEVAIGDMPGGSTASISFRVRIVDAVDLISNQGFVVSAETEPHPTDDPDTPAMNDRTVTDPPMFNDDSDVLKRDEFIDVDKDGGVSIGDLILYTITLHNSGLGTAHQVVFTDTIPQYTQYLEGWGTTTQGEIVKTSPILEVAVGDMPGGSTVIITFRVRFIEQTSMITNQGYVSSSEIEPHPTDDPDTPQLNDRTVTAPPMFNGTSDVIKSDEITDVDKDGFISPGDIISYLIKLHNSGLGTAHHVVFTDSIPSHTVYVEGTATTTQGVIVRTAPVMEINIGTMPGGSEVTIRFTVRVTERVSSISNQGSLVSDETEKHPTDDPETPEKNDPTITTREDLLTDISIEQIIYADSTDQANHHYTSEDHAYKVELLVKNREDYDAYNVRIISFIPDSVEVTATNPGTPISDSLVWSIGYLPAFDSTIVSFDLQVAEIMPFGNYYLISRSFVEADNEHPQKRANNSVVDSVICFVPETPVLIPSIEADPSSIDVTDSTQIRISIPVNTIYYDLWIYLPNGTIIKDFADEFFNSVVLEPDTWYTIADYFKPGHLLTNSDEEEVIFEIRTIDNRNRSAVERAVVTVHSSDYLVLDRNVFRPLADDHLEIKFKLSSRRTAVLDVYDIAGTHIHKLVEAEYQGGWNSYKWNGLGEGGQKIGSGVYIITLRSGEFKSWKKFIIVR